MHQDEQKIAGSMLLIDKQLDCLFKDQNRERIVELVGSYMKFHDENLGKELLQELTRAVTNYYDPLIKEIVKDKLEQGNVSKD